MSTPLRWITEVPCECPACGWTGLTGNCEADVDGDGSMGCPRCHTIVTIYSLPHERGGERGPIGPLGPSLPREQADAILKDLEALRPKSPDVL